MPRGEGKKREKKEEKEEKEITDSTVPTTKERNPYKVQIQGHVKGLLNSIVSSDVSKTALDFYWCIPREH